MSLSRLCARVVYLEGRHTRSASPSALVIVWLADRDIRATALQKVELTPAEMARMVVLLVQYAETRPHAL